MVLVEGRFGLGDIEALHAVEEVFKDVAAGLQGAVDEGVVGVGVVNVDDDAAGRGHIGDAVDEDEFAQDLVMTEGIDDNRFLQEERADGDFVLRKARSAFLFACIDVDGVVDISEDADDFLGPQFDDVFFADSQVLVIHPEHGRCNALTQGDVRPLGKDAAPGYVDFAVELDVDRLAFDGRIDGIEADEDGFDLSFFLAGQGRNRIADGQGAAFDLALEAAEGVVRAADALDGQVKAFFFVFFDVDRFQIVEDGRPLVPGHIGRRLGDVVPFRRRDGDEDDVGQFQFVAELGNLGLDFFKAFLAVAGQVHLVDGEDEVADPHEGADAGMAAGLDQDALGGVDEDDGQVGKGSADGHVARIFFMARRVGDDEAAVVRAEITVSYVDGDALFPFCHEAVQEQRVVDGPAAAADLAFQFQSLLLVGVEQFGVIEQMTDECRFAVIDAAAGNKF